MPKSEKQKLKLLYIAKILLEETDEQHPIGTAQLIKKLAELDITAERKSIYSDVRYLQEFGMDIELSKAKKAGGYYIASREFELAELKILVDMVQASRFLSSKKSRILIKKLEGMTDRYHAGELQRTVYVANRVKAENETIYYGVDKIHMAIQNNKGITFRYLKYSVDKEQIQKKDGEKYIVSPYYLTWNNENYYLIGVDEKSKEIRHYRVDRMKQIEVSENERIGQELFGDFDIANYTNATFGMFGGTKEKIKINFREDLIGVVIDRFGKEVMIHPQSDGTFTTIVEVVPSSQFYGWLTGLGTRARIVSPKHVAEDYHDYIGNIYRAYSLS